MLPRPRVRTLGLLALCVLALGLGSESPAPQLPPAPLVGFSYSPQIATWRHTTSAQDFSRLLTLQPDLVRLPIYWERVEPTPTSLDFSSVDPLLAAVSTHNATTPRPTRVILVLGARNFLYPELHQPSWAGPRHQPDIGLAQASPAYHAYFDTTILRYRSSPLLYAWQVENEPFDSVSNPATGFDAITTAQITYEINRVHALDPHHKVALTSFDAWNPALDVLQQSFPGALPLFHHPLFGHPGQALASADALGLDIYLSTPGTPLPQAGITTHIAWKQSALAYWSAQAASVHKPLWLTEMQAQPWAGLPGFTPQDLLQSALAYRYVPLQVALLWGADTWLASPAWYAASQQAIAILRSPSSPRLASPAGS